MECLQVIKEAIPRKTLNKWRFRLVVCWIAVGTVLCGAFSIIESKESRSDFRCDVRDEIDKDIIRDECYHQYLQSHELGIPSYFFILINVSVIPIVTVLYSYCVKSTVRQLEHSYQDGEGVPRRNRRGSRLLFSAYLFQLVVSIALGITFIALLQTHLLYPTNFLCSNKKFLVKVVLNRTQSTNSFACFYDKAGDKNFSTNFATAANAIYATSALLEILLILKRARDATIVLYIRQFYADYLKSNSYEQLPLAGQLSEANTRLSDVQSAVQTRRENCLGDTEQPSDQRQAQSEAIPSVEPQHRAAITTGYSEQPENSEIAMTLKHTEPVQAPNDFSSAIQTLKEDCLRGTEQLSDLKQPFRRPNPGEGPKHDLKIDEIYVNVAIHEGRALHDLRKTGGNSSKHTRLMQRTATSQNQRILLTKSTQMFSLLAVLG